MTPVMHIDPSGKNSCVYINVQKTYEIFKNFLIACKITSDSNPYTRIQEEGMDYVTLGSDGFTSILQFLASNIKDPGEAKIASRVMNGPMIFLDVVTIL